MQDGICTKCQLRPVAIDKTVTEGDFTMTIKLCERCYHEGIQEVRHPDGHATIKLRQKPEMLPEPHPHCSEFHWYDPGFVGVIECQKGEAK